MKKPYIYQEILACLLVAFAGAGLFAFFIVALFTPEGMPL